MNRVLLGLSIVVVLASLVVVGIGCGQSTPAVAQGPQCGPQGCPITGAPADMADPAAYARSAAPVNPDEPAP